MTSTKSTTGYLSLLNGLRHREDLLRIFIFTLVTVFFWIGFEIYLSQQRTKVPEDYQKYTLPLNPNIDREALQEIENRRGFSDEDLSNFSVNPLLNSEEINDIPTSSTSLVSSSSALPTTIPTSSSP